MNLFIKIGNKIFNAEKIEAIEANESTQCNERTVLTVTMYSGREYTVVLDGELYCVESVFDALRV